MIVGYYKNYLYTKDISLALKKKKIYIYIYKESQHMVSHPETGSDSPIGSDRDRGRDTYSVKLNVLHMQVTLWSHNIHIKSN